MKKTIIYVKWKQDSEQARLDTSELGSISWYYIVVQAIVALIDPYDEYFLAKLASI